jgi:serine/threonine-protein kinase
MKKNTLLFLLLLTGCIPITPASTPGPGIGSKQISAKDGMVMVFVPEGDFQMGSDDDTDYDKPEHTVWLDAFWIDQTEITNTQFEKFVKETNYKTDAELAGWSYVFNTSSSTWPKTEGANWQHPRGPASNLDGLGDHPVGYVSWNDAAAYCKWAGRRLPSEAEWEKAARGTDGRLYPWGNQKPGGNLLNFADKSSASDFADKNVDDGFAFTSPVGHYPEGASPYGALDMAGNVWEWVNDWYRPDYYLSQTIWSNPVGPPAWAGKVLRGGSWDDTGRVTRSILRLAYYPMDWYAYFGFRCAVSQ